MGDDEKKGYYCKVGWRIHKLLKRKGMSCGELARQLGVETSTVTRWCNGERLPTVYRIAQVRRILMCRWSDLLGAEL